MIQSKYAFNLALVAMLFKTRRGIWKCSPHNTCKYEYLLLIRFRAEMLKM